MEGVVERRIAVGRSSPLLDFEASCESGASEHAQPAIAELKLSTNVALSSSLPFKPAKKVP